MSGTNQEKNCLIGFVVVERPVLDENSYSEEEQTFSVAHSDC